MNYLPFPYLSNGAETSKGKLLCQVSELLPLNIGLLKKETASWGQL
jgi:hypothetical protein